MTPQEAIFKKFFKKVSKKMEAKGINCETYDWTSSTLKYKEYSEEDNPTLRKVGRKVANKLKEKYPEIEVRIDSDGDVVINNSYVITSNTLYPE